MELSDSELLILVTHLQGDEDPVVAHLRHRLAQQRMSQLTFKRALERARAKKQELHFKLTTEYERELEAEKRRAERAAKDNAASLERIGKALFGG